MTAPQSPQRVVTVTLNPTIDRILEVPGFQVGEHLEGHMRSRVPAGKAINVSRVMARLGVSGTAAGWVGQDSASTFEHALGELGVTGALTPIAGATRENITIIDPSARTETHIRDRGPDIAGADIDRLLSSLERWADASTLFVFTGSAAPGLSPERFGDLLAFCQDRGSRVVVDAYGDRLRTAVARRVWMIKPNLAELADIISHPVNTDEEIITAGRRLAETIPVVLITMGSRGACLFATGRGLAGRCTLQGDQVRSTVGCGDAMLAGFLTAIIQKPDGHEAALRQGLSVAAAAALEELPADFAPEELRRLEGQVQVSGV